MRTLLLRTRLSNKATYCPACASQMKKDGSNYYCVETRVKMSVMVTQLIDKAIENIEQDYCNSTLKKDAVQSQWFCSNCSGNLFYQKILGFKGVQLVCRKCRFQIKSSLQHMMLHGVAHPNNNNC